MAPFMSWLRQWRGRWRTTRWSARGWFPWRGFRVYAPQRAHLLCEVALHGDYEPATIQSLVGSSRPNAVGIDVGANLGLISLAVMRAVPQLKVHAYEPSANSLEYLTRTHGQSGLGERWVIHPKACSDERGEAAFSLADPALGAFDGLSSSGRVPIRDQVRVATVRLDDEWASWGHPAVCWIKVDVEGSELKVLRGLERVLNQCRPSIVTEWNLINLAGSGTDPGMIFQFASDHRLSAVDPASLEPVCSLDSIRGMLAQGKDTFLLMPNERLARVRHH